MQWLSMTVFLNLNTIYWILFFLPNIKFSLIFLSLIILSSADWQLGFLSSNSTLIHLQNFRFMIMILKSGLKSSPEIQMIDLLQEC